MSHATVLVRLPSDIDSGDIGEKIAEMMLPFKESGAGDEDPPEMKNYLVFKDTEAEHREKYENETSERFKTPDGRLLFPWDDEVKKAVVVNMDDPEKSTMPEGWVHVEIPFKELFATFEEFMKDWVEEEKNEETGKYGYWHNPNAKWDWYVIGGRWRNKLIAKVGAKRYVQRPDERDGVIRAEKWKAEDLPLWMRTGHDADFYTTPPPAGKCDCCRIESLDWDRIEAETDKRIREFLADFEKLVKDEGEFSPFGGPRNAAMALGWLQCLDADEFDVSKAYWKKKWERQLRPGIDRYDVVMTKPDYAAEAKKIRNEFIAISTWARLDGKGWMEKGEMGWFGFSDATPESTEKYRSGLEEWLKAGDQKDWIVVVDYHI